MRKNTRFRLDGCTTVAYYRDASLQLLLVSSIHAPDVSQGHSRHCRCYRSAPRTSCAPPAAEELGDPPLPTSLLVNNVVRPTLAEAERRFSAALARINVEDMARQVEALK
jgi:hypothetical protein